MTSADVQPSESAPNVVSISPNPSVNPLAAGIRIGLNAVDAAITTAPNPDQAFLDTMAPIAAFFAKASQIGKANSPLPDLQHPNFQRATAGLGQRIHNAAYWLRYCGITMGECLFKDLKASAPLRFWGGQGLPDSYSQAPTLSGAFYVLAALDVRHDTLLDRNVTVYLMHRPITGNGPAALSIMPAHRFEQALSANSSFKRPERLIIQTDPLPRTTATGGRTEIFSALMGNLAEKMANEQTNPDVLHDWKMLLQRSLA